CDCGLCIGGDPISSSVRNPQSTIRNRIIHQVKEIAIVGAGELGGAVAHAVARRDLARAITLVDERNTVAAGKALDIAQAAPVEGFATQLAGSADIAVVGGADVVVIADRFGTGEVTGEEALALLRRVSQMAPHAIVVCAGASGRELVD